MHFLHTISAGIALAVLVSAQDPTPTTINTSTCSRQSIAACPTPYDPCCAFICAEAQVPFQVCSPDNETVLASCSACPPPTPTPTPTTTPPPALKNRQASCGTSGYSATGCPAAADPCCKYLCAEAQVPFVLCSDRDGTGEFESCSACPTVGARL